MRAAVVYYLDTPGEARTQTLYTSINLCIFVRVGILSEHHHRHKLCSFIWCFSSPSATTFPNTLGNIISKSSDRLSASSSYYYYRLKWKKWGKLCVQKVIVSGSRYIVPSISAIYGWWEHTTAASSPYFLGFLPVLMMAKGSSVIGMLWTSALRWRAILMILVDDCRGNHIYVCTTAVGPDLKSRKKDKKSNCNRGFIYKFGGRRISGISVSRRSPPPYIAYIYGACSALHVAELSHLSGCKLSRRFS